MTIGSALALLGAVTIFALTPGPAIAAGVARALASGFRSAVALNVGIVIGDVLFLMLAIYGLATVAQVLGGFFVAVKLAGAAYLIWLGWTMWTRRWSRIDAERSSGEPGFWRGVLAGLLITLGNPKVILFYVGFLPAFMDLARLTTLDVVIVTAIVTSVLMIVNCAYAWSASRARSLFRSKRAARNLDRGAGTVMIGTGLIIATR